MLVLARQVHERIVIPVIDTAIEVVSARPSWVRLGIDAPSTVTVLREELYPEGLARETSPLPLCKKSLQKQLDNVLIDLSRLKEQTRALKHPALTVSTEKITNEVARLSCHVCTLLHTHSAAVAGVVTSQVQCM